MKSNDQPLRALVASILCAHLYTYRVWGLFGGASAPLPSSSKGYVGLTLCYISVRLHLRAGFFNREQFWFLSFFQIFCSWNLKGILPARHVVHRTFNLNLFKYWNRKKWLKTRATHVPNHGSSIGASIQRASKSCIVLKCYVTHFFTIPSFTLSRGGDSNAEKLTLQFRVAFFWNWKILFLRSTILN